MTVKEIDGIAGLETMVGEELGISDWHVVGQDQIQDFADATLDRQWIHVDVQKAMAGPFAGPVAHGYLTLSMLPFFSQQAYRVTGLTMVVNYGLNKVRFPAPVPVGARIRDNLTLVSLTPRSQGARMVVRHEIELEFGARPACVAETVALLFD